MAEVRIAIEQYEVKSPIYGLVQYRRRKVVLKYVPEGTSRLLQGALFDVENGLCRHTDYD